MPDSVRRDHRTTYDVFLAVAPPPGQARSGRGGYSAAVGMVLALLSSVLWGVGDFAGGTATRRLPVFVVVVASQAAGLLVVVIVATATGEWSAPASYIPWAIAAGLVGVTGLLAFYEALARGTMGVVSPIAALSVVVPVVVGLVLGEWPPLIVGIGFLLAIGGVVAASGPERASGRSLRPILLGLVAAVCFGAVLILISRGAASSPVMTMVVMRTASVSSLSALILARRRRAAAVLANGAAGASPTPIAKNTGVWAVVVIAGVFDVAANLAFAFASTASLLAVVAILGSLYPAVTVVLARIIHGERMTGTQQLGIVVALSGVALIAGWS